MSNPIEVYLKSFGSLPSLPSSEKELSVNMKIKKKLNIFILSILAEHLSQRNIISLKNFSG
jgi:hypothetical protein